MKKHTVTLFAIAALAAAGCTKEEWHELPTTAMEESVGTTLYYSIDGTRYSARAHSRDDQRRLIDWLATMAREGHTVKVGRTASLQGTAKETVTFTTPNKDEATQWVYDMLANGYLVTMEYDPDHGVFICTATK